ncbi:MAG: hypothetical protein ACYDAR_20230 [Thermomicrobiales bacterium]
MAIAVLMEFPAGTLAQYDAVIEEMKLGGKLAPHGIFHIAGPMEGGGIRIVDVWDSQEAFDDFARNKIGPITQKHGIAAPNLTIWPAHNMLR